MDLYRKLKPVLEICPLPLTLAFIALPFAALANEKKDPPCAPVAKLIESHQHLLEDPDATPVGVIPRPSLVGLLTPVSERPGATGIGRIGYKERIDHALVFNAPEMRFSEYHSSGRPLTANAMEYVNPGKSAESLAKERIGVEAGEALQKIGRGGTQTVFTHASIPDQAVKTYDAELMRARMTADLENAYQEALAAGNHTAAAELEGNLKVIQTGPRAPLSVYRKIAALIQRQRTLGQELRHNILPHLQEKMKKKIADVRITMVKGLEEVDEYGTSVVELVKTGSVAGEPGGTRWVEAKELINSLESRKNDFPGAADLLGKIRGYEAHWNDALREFNERIINADINGKLGLDFKKFGNTAGLDIGTRGDNMANVFLKLGPNNELLEIKIIDF